MGGYVARPWNQGSKTFRDYMWLGFADKRRSKPREEVQFQVSILRNELWIDLFVDQAARETKKRVRNRIAESKEEFLRRMKMLSNCCIGYTGVDELQVGCDKIDEADVAQILANIAERGIHFFVRRTLLPTEAIGLRQRIVPEILYTWSTMRPLYELLEPDRTSETPEIITTPVKDDKGIKNHLARQYSSIDINLHESKAEATERESRQITYEANWLAQEKASSEHRRAVMLLADYLRRHGIEPFQSVIDVKAEKNNRIFLFEIKSVHTRNFISQTRMAIGQLFDYEYFQIKSKAENGGKEISKGVVYGRKPSQEVVDFLTSLKFSVHWFEGGKVSGDVQSMKVLEDFVLGTS
ncbi:MAG: hypothetical protein HY528_00860 [Chloroflexi bacterium]|nr:hypothetical protein [Chloroflexota bacterium]